MMGDRIVLSLLDFFSTNTQHIVQEIENIYWMIIPYTTQQFKMMCM